MEHHDRDYYKRLAKENRQVAELARLRGDQRKAQAFEWIASIQEKMN